MKPITLIPLLSIPLIRPGDNLADIILNAPRATKIELADNDILVLEQKIVSKAEGRLINLAEVIPSSEAVLLATRSEKDPRMVELILRESNEVLRVRPGTIIVEHKLGFVCANAGIGHSNVSPSTISPPLLGEGLGERSEDWVLLLPQDPDHSAGEPPRQNRIFRWKKDRRNDHRLARTRLASRCGRDLYRPLRPARHLDKRGDPDLFGYRLRITLIAAACQWPA